MDDLTASTVRRIGYKNICMSENLEVIRAQFRQIYESMASRKKQDSQLPPKLLEMIEGIGIERESAVPKLHE